MEQVDANLDQLLLPETAKRFVLSIGIMEEVEWDTGNQTEKGKIKNEAEAKKAQETIKKIAIEKK